LHEKRIIHGGLHPGKIHVTSGGVPKITSLSRPRAALGQGRTTSSDSEAAGDLRSYLPPELSDGFRRRLDRTVDVFALGAILHTMLTGKAPGPDDKDSGTGSGVREQLTGLDRPAPASSLEAICRRCLVKEPGERFSSASELALELEKLFSRFTS
jgi:serine/threonine protein kinase